VTAAPLESPHGRGHNLGVGALSRSLVWAWALQATTFLRRSALYRQWGRCARLRERPPYGDDRVESDALLFAGGTVEQPLMDATHPVGEQREVSLVCKQPRLCSGHRAAEPLAMAERDKQVQMPMDDEGRP
jgi:hypothetical protein